MINAMYPADKMKITATTYDGNKDKISDKLIIGITAPMM
jgi:hypothetical protein